MPWFPRSCRGAGAILEIRVSGSAGNLRRSHLIGTKPPGGFSEQLDRQPVADAFSVPTSRPPTGSTCLLPNDHAQPLEQGGLLGIDLVQGADQHRIERGAAA